MQESAEKEARKALVRLRRALEKSRRELDALAGAIRLAEGEDFPVDAYERSRLRIGEVLDFLEGEGHRLEAKILFSGGVEPGRIRRSSDTPPG
jgi:DNA-binding SARP family transcriptional activator